LVFSFVWPACSCIWCLLQPPVYQVSMLPYNPPPRPYMDEIPW
jgi:hypothetical protein